MKTIHREPSVPFFVICLIPSEQKGGENRMTKTVSRDALVKEAAYWNAMKQLAKQNPGMVCRK